MWTHRRVQGDEVYTRPHSWARFSVWRTAPAPVLPRASRRPPSRRSPNPDRSRFALCCPRPASLHCIRMAVSSPAIPKIPPRALDFARRVVVSSVPVIDRQIRERFETNQFFLPGAPAPSSLFFMCPHSSFPGPPGPVFSFLHEPPEPGFSPSSWPCRERCRPPEAPPAGSSPPPPSPPLPR